MFIYSVEGSVRKEISVFEEAPGIVKYEIFNRDSGRGQIKLYHKMSIDTIQSS